MEEQTDLCGGDGPFLLRQKGLRQAPVFRHLTAEKRGRTPREGRSFVFWEREMSKRKKRQEWVFITVDGVITAHCIHSGRRIQGISKASVARGTRAMQEETDKRYRGGQDGHDFGIGQHYGITR
jgi:hypothetical protein